LRNCARSTHMSCPNYFGEDLFINLSVQLHSLLLSLHTEYGWDTKCTVCVFVRSRFSVPGLHQSALNSARVVANIPHCSFEIWQQYLQGLRNCGPFLGRRMEDACLFLCGRLSLLNSLCSHMNLRFIVNSPREGCEVL